MYLLLWIGHGECSTPDHCICATDYAGDECNLLVVTEHRMIQMYVPVMVVVQIVHVSVTLDTVVNTVRILHALAKIHLIQWYAVVKVQCWT
jgi:hypothetical protein